MTTGWNQGSRIQLPLRPCCYIMSCPIQDHRSRGSALLSFAMTDADQVFQHSHGTALVTPAVSPSLRPSVRWVPVACFKLPVSASLINVVAQRWAGLLLPQVTVSEQVYNQPPRTTQPGHPSEVSEVPAYMAEVNAGHIHHE